MQEAAPRAYRDRHPRLAMDAANLLEILNLLEQAGVIVWIDGGWGVMRCWASRRASTTISTLSSSSFTFRV